MGGRAAAAVPQILEDSTPDRKWIIFDGPVDTLWIESMNSVLDDSKLLCLDNGVRMKVNDTVHMLFEVEDLAVASPATVSRCGMVYMDRQEVGWRNVVKAWVQDRAAKVPAPPLPLPVLPRGAGRGRATRRLFPGAMSTVRRWKVSCGLRVGGMSGAGAVRGRRGKRRHRAVLSGRAFVLFCCSKQSPPPTAVGYSATAASAPPTAVGCPSSAVQSCA